MPDPLYLSVWFPSFTEAEMVPRTLSVLRLFPMSAVQPGVHYLAIHPVAWSEATVLEQRFEPGVTPEAAADIVAELLHGDYAYGFELAWDLWSPAADGGEWKLEPRTVKITVHGSEFDEGAFQQMGHIQLDFGLDTPFLFEEVALTPEAQAAVRANIHKLVEFTSKIEKEAGLSGRVLWSESEENLAQKLISRLQRVQ